MERNILTDKEVSILHNTMSSTGIFVTCGFESPNIMVTHFGAVGKMWGRQIFVLPIRSNKYSYQIVNNTKQFALNVPAHDMRTEISLCDTISGFKCNKFETLGLHPKRARAIKSYVLGECGLIVECKLIASIPPETIIKHDELNMSSRPHTLFVGEPVSVYSLKK